MILAFSTELNGKLTVFIEKIWEGFFRHNFFDGKDIEFNKYLDEHKKKFGKLWDELPEETRLEYPKIHTIRKDSKNRWKPGLMIDFLINSRTKDAFRFAPRVPVVSVQTIVISNSANGFRVSIGGEYQERSKVYRLAKNDGFDYIEDFENYFISQMENGFYSGKIIHWTKYRY